MLYPLTHILQCPHVLTQALLDSGYPRRAKLAWIPTASSTPPSRFWPPRTTTCARPKSRSSRPKCGPKTSRLWACTSRCVLWDTNDTSRRENVERATAAFRYMFGTESVVESYLALPVFFGLLPGNAWQVPDRWLTSTADRGACYTHWTATYKTDPVGEYLTDRFRNLVQVNLFNTALDNQNAIVIGPSGSGKSYTFGNLIVQRFEKGARQIIMDVGGTYRNVLQSLNGEDFDNTYFEYDPQRPIEFNPFVVPRDAAGKWLYNDEKTNFHLALLAALWKGGKDTGLDKSERTILSRFLIEYYACLNESPRLNQKDEEFPGMESFYRFVEQFDQRNAEARGRARRRRGARPAGRGPPAVPEKPEVHRHAPVLPGAGPVHHRGPLRAGAQRQARRGFVGVPAHLL